MQPKGSPINIFQKWNWQRVWNFLNKPDYYFTVAILLVFIYFITKTISVAMTHAFSFDGAIFAQVAQNLAFHHVFATNYEYAVNFLGNNFDPIITTGIPLILPLAISFKLFGVSFESGLFVSSIYLNLAALALFYYLKKCLKIDKRLILLALILFIGTPFLFWLGFGPFGEIPMFFYFLITIIFLHGYSEHKGPHLLFWSGFFFGLGYLTKTVILIYFPSILIFLFFTSPVFISEKRRFHITASRNVKFLFGFAIPVFIFELYKLLSLGWPAYLQNLRGTGDLLVKASGIGVLETAQYNLFSRFSNNLHKLSSFTKIEETIFLALLALLFLVWLTMVVKEIQHYLIRNENREDTTKIVSTNVILIYTATLSHYGWWLILLPTELAWDRYIFPGFLLMEISIVILLSMMQGDFGLKAGSEKPGYARVLSLGVVFSLMTYFSFYFVKGNNYRISFTDTDEKKGYMEIGQFIRSLPDSAEFFGYDLWEAPIVAFTSGRTFKDLLSSPLMESTGPFTEKFFVLDDYFYRLDPGDHQSVLSQFDTQLVYSNPNSRNYVYSLLKNNIDNYHEFSKQEKEQVSNSTVDFRGEVRNVYVRKVYIDENNLHGKWAQKVSGYLLKYAGEHKLIISLEFKSLQNYDQSPIEIQVLINGDLARTFTIKHDGPQDLYVPIIHLGSDTLEVSIKCNAQLVVDSGDTRQLSVFISSIKLE